VLTKELKEFTFIDLFAGIGGFRLGLESIGGKCVFSCEVDKHAAKTYEAWYGDNPLGDVTQLNPLDVPDHDILTGGFPCKSFSIAGVSQRVGTNKPHGFDDKDTGHLFFEIIRILKVKCPPVVLLENVKNLRSHNQGRTFSTIQKKLGELGYKVFYEVIDAKYYVPQHRERIIIVGLRKDVFGEEINFEFPNHDKLEPKKLKSILEENPDPAYTLPDGTWAYLQRRKQTNIDNGKGFGYSLANPEGITRTLSARYGKDGAEILIKQSGNPRKLTTRETARLMGFPDHLPIVVSKTQAYKQFGNAVVPLIIKAVGLKIRELITS
jgi:DNA (cytosine-5)-methyltransferase 1